MSKADSDDVEQAAIDVISGGYISAASYVFP